MHLCVLPVSYSRLLLFWCYYSPGVVILTDGVFNLENAFVTDALLAQLRVNAANCSFLQIGNGYGPSVG